MLKSPCVNEHEPVQLAHFTLLATTGCPRWATLSYLGQALFATLALANLVQRVAGVDGTACKEHAKAGSLLQAKRSMAMIDGEDFVPEAGWNRTAVVVAPQYVGKRG